MDPDVTWKMLCETLDELREQPDDTHLREHAIGLLEILVDAREYYILRARCYRDHIGVEGLLVEDAVIEGDRPWCGFEKGAAGCLLDVIQNIPHSCRRHLRLFGQALYLLRNDRESFAMLARFRRFDGGIHREKV